jgi:hypothetical protein
MGEWPRYPGHVHVPNGATVGSHMIGPEGNDRVRDGMRQTFAEAWAEDDVVTEEGEGDRDDDGNRSHGGGYTAMTARREKCQTSST